MANHTIKLELSKDEAAHFQQTHAEFHFSYGIALANWAAVERALFYWFYKASRNARIQERKYQSSALETRRHISTVFNAC